MKIMSIIAVLLGLQVAQAQECFNLISKSNLQNLAAPKQICVEFLVFQPMNEDQSQFAVTIKTTETLENGHTTSSTTSQLLNSIKTGSFRSFSVTILNKFYEEAVCGQGESFRAQLNIDYDTQENRKLIQNLYLQAEEESFRDTCHSHPDTTELTYRTTQKD